MNQIKPPLKINYFQYYFPDETACRKYLLNLFRHVQFLCKKCNKHFWMNPDDLQLDCPHCKRKYPLTTGTVFYPTRLSLQTIFALLWLLTIHSRTLNAQEIMQLLGLNSYRITWQWMQKIRMHLIFFPDVHKQDAIETDSFFFRVKSKSPSGMIKSKEVEIMIIVSRKRRFFRLLKMVVVTGKTKPERNQYIRESLPYFGLIYVPDRTWFYSDDRMSRNYRNFYRVRIGKKSKIYSPHCTLELSAKIAGQWHEWVKNHYMNNIHDEHLQGYLNAFLFHYNRPGKAQMYEYFKWVIKEFWNLNNLDDSR